jgi:Protein of unknown function (DUF3987)
VLANLVDPGVDEGVKFYDRFKLKKDDDGEWAFLKYSKLGNLIVVCYGDEWFEDPNTEFEESDFEGFEFVAQVEPKTDSKGKPLTGSTINWKSIRPAGGAEEKVVKEKVAESKASTGNLEDIRKEIEEIEEPDVPREIRYMTNDATIEKIAEILRDNPDGILYYRDELMGWLRSLDKAGREADRAFYLEA